MCSLEIAAMPGKRHSDVLRDIKRELAKTWEDERKFASVYLAGNGDAALLLPVWNLPPILDMVRAFKTRAGSSIGIPSESTPPSLAKSCGLGPDQIA